MADKDVQGGQAAAFWRPTTRGRLPGGPMSWLLVIGVLSLAVLSLFGDNGLGERLRLSHHRDDLTAERDHLRAEAATLADHLEALHSDPEALESLARERYNMRREGEQVILLIEEDRANGTQP